jgi:hypothetical protein
MRFIDLIDDGKQYWNPGFQRKGILVSHYSLIAQLGDFAHPRQPASLTHEYGP